MRKICTISYEGMDRKLALYSAIKAGEAESWDYILNQKIYLWRN